MQPCLNVSLMLRASSRGLLHTGQIPLAMMQGRKVRAMSDHFFWAASLKLELSYTRRLQSQIALMGSEVSQFPWTLQMMAELGDGTVSTSGLNNVLS